MICFVHMKGLASRFVGGLPEWQGMGVFFQASRGFTKIQKLQQRHVFLLVEEVQIRPTLHFLVVS